MTMKITKNKYLRLALLFVAAGLSMLVIFALTQGLNIRNINTPEYKSSVSYPTAPFTLSLWLPSEEKGNLEEVVADYQKIHPSAKVNIEYIDPALYQAKLLEASASGKLPDMFVFRNDGLPLYKKSIKTAPTSVYKASDFEKVFAEFTTKQLVSGNNVYGVPLGLATLGLVYNQDRFDSANISTPPASWQDFDTANSTLRKKDGQVLYASGVALGTASIRNYPDIISVLMMQNGAQMTDQPPTKATFELPDASGYYSGAKALEYYASFAQPAKQNYSYSDSLGDSLTALAQNKTAIIVDYPMAYKLAQKQSPRVNFAISALPQVNQSSPVNYGIFLTGAVSAQSQNSEIAWDFWAFATQKNQQKKFSLSSFWPASRKDLIQEQLKDKDLAPFAKQSASAQDWYKGINYAANAELREMVSSYLAGFDAKIVVKNASSKVSSEIQKSRQ